MFLLVVHYDLALKLDRTYVKEIYLKETIWSTTVNAIYEHDLNILYSCDSHIHIYSLNQTFTAEFQNVPADIDDII